MAVKDRNLMLNTLKVFIFILVTSGLTYAVIYYVSLQGFLVAWILNLMLMMYVFMLTESLESEFSSPYFNEKKWEMNGKVYKILGINFFRKLLVYTGWEKLNKNSNPVEHQTKSLSHLQYRTKQSELGHIIIMVILLGFTVFVAFKFGIGQSLWLIILNILLNLYPIFLQRYNRPRLNRALKLSLYREKHLSSNAENAC